MPLVSVKAALPRLPKTAATVPCRHCAIPFRPVPGEGEFCCSGCRFVFHLLHRRGLEDFYHYGETKSPVGSSVFQDRDAAWIPALQTRSEEEASPQDGSASATVQVQGISCAGCVWLLEAIFAEHPGAISAEVNSSAGTLRLRWTIGSCDLTSYVQDCGRFGYTVGPLGTSRPEGLRPLIRKLGLCGALALNAMLFALPAYLGLQPGDDFAALFAVVAFAIATTSILVGGTYFFRRALAALRHGEIHIDLPISLGLLAAYLGSALSWISGKGTFTYFDFVSIFTFLMLLGRWLQERAVENNRNRLLAVRLTPGTVTVLRNGLEVEAAAETLLTGERFRLARGQLVPVRSRMLSKTGLFALNWINGEPAPRTFSNGSLLPSGARSLTPEHLDALALEDWEQSQLATLLALDGPGRWRNHRLQELIRGYLIGVFLLAGAGFLGWGLVAGSWTVAFQVLISVLVVSCPCAIGVALPLLDDVTAARLQRKGVYLRDASLWARLRRVRHVLFDKTGTLTLENLVPANPGALAELPLPTREILLRLVADSLHPVASSLREHLLAAGVQPASEGATSPREITGLGIEWTTPDETWRLGRATWAAPHALAGESGTILSRDGIRVAAFSFHEEIRPDVTSVVRDLEARGLDVVILSGDAPARVQAMANNLGLPAAHGHGSLTPDDKAALVRTRWPDSALMLGDGANDSLAFDAALCRGTPAIETGLLEHKSDFYLLGRSLSGLTTLFSAFDRHRRATWAVFIFAITYNALAVSASLAGLMNPLVAAIIMPLSSLLSIGLVFAFSTSSSH